MGGNINQTSFTESRKRGGRLMPLTLSECIIDVSCTPTSSPRQLNPSIDQTFRKPNSNRSWSANDSIATHIVSSTEGKKHWSGANISICDQGPIRNCWISLIADYVLATHWQSLSISFSLHSINSLIGLSWLILLESIIKDMQS